MKGMVKIYRIEDVEGKGPYTSNKSIYLKHYDRERYPSPEMDGIEGIMTKHRFGFISIRQLRDWFDDEEISQLRSRGLKITMYRVPRSKVLFGGKQVAFETI